MQETNSKEAPAPIDFTPLEGVGSAIKWLKIHYKIFMTILIIFSTTMLWIGMYRIYTERVLTGSLIILAFLVLVLGYVWLYKTLVSRSSLIDKPEDGLNEFARINGFGMHWGRKLVPVKKGALFKVAQYGESNAALKGRKKITVRDEISGTLREFPFSFYDYTFRDRMNVEVEAKVMEITLPEKQPHLMIDSTTSSSSQRTSLPISFDSSQKIELEGDFHNYFDIYALEKDGIAALTLIAPDAMEILLGHAIRCDIEIIENKIFFYWSELNVSLEDYYEAFSTVEEVLDTFNKYLISGRLSDHADTMGVKETGSVSLKKRPWLMFWVNNRVLGRLPSLRGIGIMLAGFILGIIISLIIFDEDNIWGAVVYMFFLLGSIVLGFRYNLNRSFATKWRRRYKQRRKEVR